jgi:hypothetical protein
MSKQEQAAQHVSAARMQRSQEEQQPNEPREKRSKSRKRTQDIKKLLAPILMPLQSSIHRNVFDHMLTIQPIP